MEKLYQSENERILAPILARNQDQEWILNKSREFGKDQSKNVRILHKREFSKD